MLRSMNSAISGMDAFQQQLDVIGNNIANVNTTGFKSSSTEFEDILSQLTSGGSGPQPSASNVTPLVGGTNPMAVGLGVKVASIDTNFSQGPDNNTGVATNLAINGNGLFVTSNDGGVQLMYTREGDFTLDSNKNLVLPDGSVAVGTMMYAPGTTTAVSTAGSIGVSAPLSAAGSVQPVNLNTYWTNYENGHGITGTAVPTLTDSANLSIGQDGSINVTDPNGQRDVIGYLLLATPPNPAGLEKVGNSKYVLSANSGIPTYQTPGVNGSGTLQSGALEGSNVDLTEEFSNMIVAQRGFDANSHMIGTANAILQDVVNLKNS